MTSSPVGDVAVGRGLAVGWSLLFAILPLGHLTGLRNTETIVLVVATLAWVGRDAWRSLPARHGLVALMAWCALSIAWSTNRDVSFAKWKSDLLLPLLAYAAAFGLARRTRSLDAIVVGLVLGIVLLALVSLFAFEPWSGWLSRATWVRTERFAGIAVPMPIWYPGVGDASMAASLVAGPLLCARRIARIPRPALLVSWMSLVVVLVVANNRNAGIAIPFVLFSAVWMLRRRPSVATASGRTRLRAVVSIAIVLVVAMVVATRLETGARERLTALHVAPASGESAFVTLTERDTRPMIWRYYARLAVEHPWVGVGFGRTVPGLRYRTADDKVLGQLEPNAYIHAHDLFLDWWLQTGLVGVVLLITVWAGIARHAVRSVRRPSTGAAFAAGMSILVVVALMLIRDTTDDFLVFGMATMFWALTGGLLGLAAGSTDASTPSAGAVSGQDRA